MAIVENFYYEEGNTNAQDIIKTLVQIITVKAGMYKWTLVAPADINSVSDSALIKCTTTTNKEFYVKLYRNDSDEKRNHIFMMMGKDIENNDLKTETASLACEFSWYKLLHDNIGMWLPLQYWINVTKDSINIVLRGDPSADVYPYSNYLTSYAYIGTLLPMEDDSLDDVDNNFCITTSSADEPSYSEKFGYRTATGITDVCMVANKVGMPMQPHYPAYYNTYSYMDKCNTEGSRWNNKKHQFSDITLVHPVDMERGKMQNVLVGDASSIYDMDKLIYKKGTDEEENYRKFKINAPFNFLNNSSNHLYCLAIRCYQSVE